MTEAVIALALGFLTLAALYCIAFIIVMLAIAGPGAILLFIGGMILSYIIGTFILKQAGGWP